jgi:hypothetical protein
MTCYRAGSKRARYVASVIAVRGRTTAPKGLILGHEITGEVYEVGRDVEYIKKGDLVSVPFNIACGRCPNCKAGMTGICLNTNPSRAGAGTFTHPTAFLSAISCSCVSCQKDFVTHCCRFINSGIWAVFGDCWEPHRFQSDVSPILFSMQRTAMLTWVDGMAVKLNMSRFHMPISTCSNSLINRMVSVPLIGIVRFIAVAVMRADGVASASIRCH